MTLRAIVHIGPPKTGTTSIQNFLAASRAELRDRGFHFATAPGEINHLALAAYGAGEGFTGSAVRRAGGGGGDGASMGPRLARAIGDEIAALPEYIHTVLYSSEQLASLLTGASDVARLKQLLDPWFQEFVVLLYLRRQDEMAVSKYSTALRAGGEIDPSILPQRGREPPVYRLAEVVETWASVFGTAALRPRLLERQALIGGDVVTDFLAAVGIEGLQGIEIEAKRSVTNPALSAEAQEMVRRFNILAEMKGLADRPRLAPHLRAPRFQGKPRLPTRAEAEEFFARFDDGNERLRSRYFPGRNRLFAADFSIYPDAHEATAAIPDDRKVLNVTFDVLSIVSGALRRAELELLTREARDATAAGQTEKARARWRQVLQVAADDAEALRALAALGVEGAAEPRPRVANGEFATPRHDGSAAARHDGSAAARHDGKIVDLAADLHVVIGDALYRADAALLARQAAPHGGSGGAGGGGRPRAAAPAISRNLDGALEVLLVVAEALRKAEVELLARDARDAMAGGQREKARQRWTKVLHMAHGHPEAVQAIARLDTLGKATAPPRQAAVA